MPELYSLFILGFNLWPISHVKRLDEIQMIQQKKKKKKLIVESEIA